MKRFGFFLGIVFLFVTVRAAEEVRIDVSSGAPLIVVDGEPVRARMFYGDSGAKPIPIDDELKEYAFEFVPKESSNGRAALAIYFGAKPGSVVLDDIELKEISTGRDVFPSCNFENGIEDFDRSTLRLWDKERMNFGNGNVEDGVGSNGSAALVLRFPEQKEDVRWPSLTISTPTRLDLKEGERYRMKFHAKADPPRRLYFPFTISGRGKYNKLVGNGDVFQSQIELAAAAGVSFVSFPHRIVWPKPDENPDDDLLDTQIDLALEANPNVLLIPRIYVEAPEWWLAQHPGEAMVWNREAKREAMPWDREPARPWKAASVASEKYRNDAAVVLRNMIQRIEEKYGRNIAGYHVTGQSTNEWFYLGTWEQFLNGYGDADRIAWRDWLRKKYENDDALRKAWDDPEASLDSAEVPAAELRLTAPTGILHDVGQRRAQRKILDLNQFQQDVMVDCVAHFAKVAKDAAGRKKLVLIFYGYEFEFGDPYNGPACTGHYALSKLLKSPDVDILCAPFSYHGRSSGEAALQMSPAESVALAGKMWLNEDDLRTHLTPQSGFAGSKTWEGTQEGTLRLLTRNLGNCALGNYGTWWMDLAASGWYEDPVLWQSLMKKIEPLDRDRLVRPKPFRPEIGLFVDEASALAVAVGGPALTSPALGDVRRQAACCGAPFGQYLLDDLLDGKVDVKLNVLANAWRLDKAQRKRLKEVVKGKTNIWSYAPGYLDEENGGSLATMKELIGLTMKRVDGTQIRVTPTERGVAWGLSPEPFGKARPIVPLFAVADARPEEILATYPDGSAAVVLRKESDGTNTLFVGTPASTPELIRAAARLAGVHLFTDKNCVVYANDPYVLLHAASDGPIDIDFGRKGRIVDFLRNAELGVGPKLTLVLRKGDSLLLEAKP